MKKLLAVLLSCFLAACGGGLSGTFELDKTALDQLVGQMTAGEDTKDNPMAKMMTEMFKNMSMELTFASDGTFSANSKMSMMGQEKVSTVKGTWTLEGTTLTMTSTEEDGKASSETKTASYQDGRIVVSDNVGGRKLELAFKRKG